ncbi:MAG: orotidine-5'-phosphate decarboxylase [Spirochaetales bacterium]|nr:orotidine-5'-phosphate decarboxylase [Spirochaetales bacterium]
MSYRDYLQRSAREAGSLLCLGIDPVVEWLPAELRRHDGPADVGAVTALLEVALDALDDDGIRPAAFKPNIGYFARSDRPFDEGAARFAGSEALAATLRVLRRRMPDVPVILDAKRGDIARSSANYAEEAFNAWGADALTVSPWMGDDSVEPFLRAAETASRGVYLLTRTSNPGSARFQNLLVGDAPLYRVVADAATEWARSHPSVGVVLGATAPEELDTCLRALGARPIPVLIPGVGRQGGSAAEVLRIIRDTGYPPHLIRINASSGALFPWAAKKAAVPNDWRGAVSSAVTALHAALRWEA